MISDVKKHFSIPSSYYIKSLTLSKFLTHMKKSYAMHYVLAVIV